MTDSNKLIAGVSKKVYITGMIGLLGSMTLFFVALFLREYIRGYLMLIYPLLLVSIVFYGNYWQTGSYKSSWHAVIKGALFIGIVMVVAVIFKKIQS